jgi:outer membrane lipoprotein-sorting protein
MQTLTRSAQAGALGLGLALLALAPAHADPSASSIWKKTEAHLRSMKDYTCHIDYKGAKGEMQYDYACVRPDAIKTVIVKGEKAGAILIYRPSEYGQCVKARKGFLGKEMKLDDPAVANSPVVTPVFDMVLGAAKSASNVTLTGNDVVLGHGVYCLRLDTASGTHEVCLDKANGDVLRWKNPQGDTRTFYDIHANVSPRISF